jgi:hypothetical protein
MKINKLVYTYKSERFELSAEAFIYPNEDERIIAANLRAWVETRASEMRQYNNVSEPIVTRTDEPGQPTKTRRKRIINVADLTYSTQEPEKLEEYDVLPPAPRNTRLNRFQDKEPVPPEPGEVTLDDAGRVAAIRSDTEDKRLEFTWVPNYPEQLRGIVDDNITVWKVNQPVGPVATDAEAFTSVAQAFEELGQNLAQGFAVALQGFTDALAEMKALPVVKRNLAEEYSVVDLVALEAAVNQELDSEEPVSNLPREPPGDKYPDPPF